MKTVYVIYDGECPFCSDYVKAMRIKNITDKLILINARTDPYQQLLNNNTFDLNEGMLVVIDGKYYHASEAVQILALVTTPLSWLNKVNYALFRIPAIANIYYPICRSIRNLALKIKGVPKI